MNGLENKHSALRDFADYVLAETQRVRKLDPTQASTDLGEVVHRFTLSEYVQAMDELGGNLALAPEFIDKKIQNIREDFYKFKSKVPQGTKCLIALFPCNQNGTLYIAEEMKKGKQLEMFLIDPQTGLTIHGDTLAAMLPQELHEQCSFTVEYRADSPFLSPEEWRIFETKLRSVYANLQSLFTGYQA